MKTIVKKEVKQYVNEEIEITGATLLSIEEAEQLPIGLRKYDNWWWLRSPGYDFDLAALVYFDGSVGDGGDLVYRSYNTVRPALQISDINSSNLQIGDIFEFGDVFFKIISDKLALCLTDIGTHCFRKDRQYPDANNYEKSDIKKYVDDWFNESKESADATIE